MKKIHDYVEVMFQEFPKTKKINDIKANIIDAMESKYEDLIAEGKTEQEAVGVVIAQFGNIDELKEEFGMEVDENVEYLGREEAKAYLRFKEKFAKMIGIGVAMIILGAGGTSFSYLSEFHESLSVYVLLMIVAVAVLIFVLMGLENAKYEEIDSAKYRLEADEFVFYQKEFERFTPGFNIAIGMGVLLCIFGASSTVLMEDILKLSKDSFAFILFPCVALAVFLFIYMGVRYSSYRVLVNPDKVQKELKEEESDHGWIFGVTMPIAAMGYLVLGFVYGCWHPGWLIFPITAICTSGLMMILNHTRNK